MRRVTLIVLLFASSAFADPVVEAADQAIAAVKAGDAAALKAVALLKWPAAVARLRVLIPSRARVMGSG